MGERQALDLLSLDRDAACGHRALSQWRAALARDPEAHAGEQPLQAVRWVAGKSTWDTLSAMEPSAMDAPLREALLRWVYALTQARIGLPGEVAWARAAAQQRGRLSGEEPRRVSWREAWRGVVASRSVAETAAWLEAAADCAPPMADVAREQASRRVEVARRFGLDHPCTLLVPVQPGALREAAARLLDATEDLWRAVWKRGSSQGASAAAVLHKAMARDAGEGWPARLTARWFEDAFGAGPRAMEIELEQLPSIHGAASFARALVLFGVAVRVGPFSSSTSFALANEPEFVAPHALGFGFGALAADAQWQHVTLGVSRRVAKSQARLLARTAFVEARLHATRLLLGDDALFAPADAFEELSVRLFEGGLDPRLRGAWPNARIDESARFLGLLQARALAETLVERFDSDWYRNPHAWEHLRALRHGPTREPIADGALAKQVDALALTFEASLA